MRAIVWCAAVCLAAAGCASDPPVGSSTTPSSPPPVTRTLDPSAFATEETVCGLLTDDQAVELGLREQSKPHRTGDTVLECQRMRQGDDRFQVEYDLFLDSDVLGSWYDSGADLQLRDIEGQPAGVQELAGGSRCKVAVRLAERTSLHVFAPDEKGKDACSLVIPVAERIVRNLEG